MSGIYIPGMEMPELGFVEVRIHPDGRCETRDEADVPCVTHTAIPVPDHGRLIEAEAVKELLKPVDSIRNYEPEWTWGELYESDCVAIDKLPTIIPASKEDDT